MSFKSSGYKSLKAKVVPDWAKQSKKKPIIDKQAVAYGWVIEGDFGLTSIMTTDEHGKKIIDQGIMGPMRDAAIQKLFKFYNKYSTARNLQIAKSNAWVEDVRVPIRPKSQLLSYVLIDARAFDNISEVGKYTLQLVPDGATLHTLADDYVGYFHVNDATDMGHRARISEILRANNIDIEVADEASIESWISSVNGDSTVKTSFKEGAKIFLPVISMPEPPNPAFIISLEIGEIQDTITKANINLEVYKKKIDNFEAAFGKVENLKLEEQILDLKEFYPALRSHIELNDIEIKNVVDDDIDIFLNEDYEIIYIAINKAGEKMPLLKAMPMLSSLVPFNNLRTMALLVKIKDVSNIGTNTILKVQNQQFYAPKIPWEDFVERYIIPPVIIKNTDPGKLFDQLLETNSVVAGLVQKFSTESYKSEKQVEEEDKVLADPQIIGAAVAQEEKSYTPAGDVVISNLARISAKIGAASAASGKRVLDSTYSEVLNRIPVDKLIKETIDCLKKLMSCREMIEGILDKNLMLGYGTFKVKLPPEKSYLADRAMKVAETGQFIMDGVDYSEVDIPANNSPGLKFLAVLELALRKEGFDDFDRILVEVCRTIENPPVDALLNFFKIPLVAFPDDLPVVDLQAAIATMLEAAIVELLTGLIVGMVQAILEQILWFCKEETEATPDDADFGGADLLDALANRVGAGSIADLLADFYDAMGDYPPTSSPETIPPAIDPSANTMGTCTLPDGTVAAMTKSDCLAAGGSWTKGTPGSSFMDLGTDKSIDENLLKDVARKCFLIKKLLSDLSAILTPAELSALFNGTASPVVLDTIVDVIQVRHIELYEKINTREKVVVMFGTLENLVDVSAILAQITTISRGLGCTFESKCIRDGLRDDNFPGEVPDDGTTKRILELLDDPTNLDGLIPPTFCEEKGSTIDNGLIPKDSTSLLFVLKKVIGVMYDGIYMAYDAEAMRIPDGLSVPAEKKKIIERTTLQGAKIDFDLFNFFKMQEENFTIEFPEWLPKKTVINPEFQRLVAQGYIPPDGDPQGQFGPYTTEKLKIAGILPTPFSSAPLDAITVPEKYFIFAADSRYGLKHINKLKVGADEATNSMFFALTQPYKEGGNFRPSNFSLKFTLAPAKDENDYKNTFMLQIGDIPVDPSTIPIGGNLPPGQLTPSVSFAPFEAAIYRSRLAGVTSIDRDAEKIIEMLQEQSGNTLITPGSVPQVSVLYGFIDNVSKGATNTVPPQLKDFVYNKMYGDLLLQVISGIGSEVLGTPLFKKTKEDKTPYVKIVDWAPIPTDDERECDFDPHILALDTVKKRTKEAYEQYIKCSPLEDEIAVDGLGRTNLSALEAAGMTGCVMTTLRAYALEQLLRAMYPVSVFAGEEFITKLMVEYIIEETLRGVKRVGQAYYDSFLTQVEVIFKLRMKPFCPFGSVPDILKQSAEIGINWMYADAAIKEFSGTPSGEEIEMEEFDSVLGATASCDDSNEGSVNTTTSVRSSKEQMVRSRIRFLAEEQLYSLMPKLQDLICLNGTLTFDDNFLNRRLPLFDVQREKGEMRLSKKFETLRAMEEEELNRQYDQYLKEFAKWEDNRLINLLDATFTTITDIADTVGTSVSCLVGAFSPPPLPEGEEDISFWDDPMGAAAQSFDSMIGGASKLASGESFTQLEQCVDEAVGGGPDAAGLIGTVEKMLSVLTDTPPPLETFGSGLDEGATDRIDNLSSFNRGGAQSDFPLTDQNGAMILEKYIKVRKKGFTDDSQNTLADLNLGQENFPSDIPGTAPSGIESPSISPNVPTNGLGSVTSFRNTTESGLTLSQVLCPREVIDTSARTNTPFVQIPEGTTANVSVVPGINPELEQIYSIEEWQDVFSEKVANHPSAKFEDLYESWSCGVRLVYVAPTNEFQEVPDSSSPGASEQTLKVPTRPGAASNPVDFLFNTITADASRSYRQFERIEVERKEMADPYTYPGALARQRNFLGDGIVSGPERDQLDAAMGMMKTYETEGHVVDASDSMGSLGDTLGHEGFQINIFPQRDTVLTSQLMNDQINATGAFKKIQMERALTIFPLSEVDISINISPTTKLSNVLSSVKVGRNKEHKDLNELWRNQYMSALMNNLKESPGYKLLFKYCTPSHTLLSFSSIYANLLNEMTETFWDGTKAELKKLFEILLNGGDYTFENEDEKKNGGNREQMAHAQSNMGTTGGARKPGLFDLALQTPKLIFKGLAEFLDPVIAPAAVIVKAGKAGKLLPKFMKKVDDAGNETEENFLLKVTVGPYDLPPPMGKFSLPLPDFLQPDDYVEPMEGLSDNPSDNITFELPVFSFTDMITGASMDPFLREKVFKLRTGNSAEKQLYYEFSKAVATFNVVTVIAIITKIYLEAMNDDSCATFMNKDKNGVPIIPVPTLVYPGDKLDLPITPVALASLPMDMLAGYGPGPPHSPLGYIYHAIVAAESLAFPDIGSKERQRRKAAMENKKKPGEKLCIDIDLIREEEDKRRG